MMGWEGKGAGGLESYGICERVYAVGRREAKVNSPRGGGSGVVVRGIELGNF